MTGDSLGPFAVRERVAVGGMGEVWLGEHVEQEVPVAVKVLRDAYAAEPRFVRAFLAEVRAVAGLDHPNIVRVLDFGTTPASSRALPASLPYLVMEWMPRGSLRSKVGVLDWPAVRQHLLAILDALAHAHARGVVHQDLKPDNVLSSATGPRLSDFGLARSLGGSGADADATLSGTPAYMSPEQIAGDARAVGPWTDLYALGCMAWELVAGRTPFTGDARTLLRAQVLAAPPPLEPTGSAPAGLEDWLRRLLAKAPGDRFQTAAEAAWALQALGAAPASSAPTPAVDPARPATEPLDTLTFDAALPEPEPRPARFGAAPRTAVPMPRDWRRPGRVPLSPRLLGAGLTLLDLRRPRLVGHEAARDRLWGLLADVRREGRAAFVELRGTEGLGRSAVAEWLCTRAAELGVATPVWVSCAEGHARDVVAEAIEVTLGCVGLDEAAVGDHLSGLVGRRGVAAGSDFADLVSVLRPSAGRSPSAPRPVVAYRWLGRLAADGAAVVVLDDAAESPQALALLRTAVRMRDSLPAPILFVVTADPAQGAGDSETAAPDDVPGEGIELSPLSAEEIRDLVRGLLPLDPSLGARLEDASGGNPQLALAMLRAWAAEDLLERQSGGFGLRAGRTLPLPGGLVEVWGRRLDGVLRGRASPELELAATLGVIVDRAEWEAACASRGWALPDDVLGDVARAGLVHGAFDRRMRFAHPALAEELRRRAAAAGRLAEHHHTCATLLRGSPHLERYARHLLGSGAAREALLPLRNAAIGEGSNGRVDRADALYGLWLEAAAQAGVPETDPQVPYVLALRGATIYRGHPGRARELAERALRLSREGAEPEHALGEVMAEYVFGCLAARAGDRERGVSHLQAALALARRSRQRRMAYLVAYQLCQAYEDGGQPERSLSLLLGLVDELGLEGVSRAQAFLNLGGCYVATGDLVRARQYLQDALVAAEGVDRVSRPAIDVYLGMVDEREGRPQEAEARYRAAYAQARANGDPYAVVAQIHVATACLRSGRFAEAHAAASEVLPDVAGAAARTSAAVYACLAWANAGLGDPGGLAESLERALRHCREGRVAEEALAERLEEAARAARDRGLDARGAGRAAADMWDALGRSARAVELRAAVGALGD